ncbi:ST3 beta-galactoside alpha-2,3-sialyltransferase 3 [Homo sapiens]|uniref:ST3 beta-galactoside alpha-2,3-sialyltransferase 3 n=1 Tax=Homo sapiens TaxID=9606 RepID=A0A2R8Y7B2_HUMAN|nr:ST3 beta-galactoside alpha-2,3-sialyltransferase 3 [Homo sapiens]KAI4080209.1 ST3 beta-galactoside alpha-2,3-sialyltransferase 3 [Homo sapiens]
MGLLVFVRNLLLALCLFLVLGFLYYSAWKLHLLQWEEDSKYDRLGFLLNLDSKLPAELATKYANFSEGACKPGYASALMTAIFPRFSKPAPMFLDDSFRKWARIREFVPPFGIKGQDNLIKAILSVTKEYRLTPALDSLVLDKGVGSRAKGAGKETWWAALCTEVSASLPSASAAAAASSWAMEAFLPTSLWGHELTTMTLW